MTPVREALKEARALISATPASALNYDAPYDEYYALLERIDEALSAAPGEPCAWVKRLADNWRGRRDSLTGDSVRDSCADELEKVAACHATPQPAAGWDEAIEVCIRELQYCRDHGHEPDITTIKKLTALRREAPAPAEGVTRPTVTMHQSIAGQGVCPACGKDFARPDTAEARLREACRNILPYLRWTISDESPGHHPTMPSAVAQFEAALSLPSGGDDAKKSEGEWVLRKGGYFYRPKAQGYTASVLEAGRWTEAEARAYTVGVEGVTAHQVSEFESPSEPSPPADRREIVARIIDPDAFSMIPGQSWEALARMEAQSEAQLAAERKADAILAARAQSDDASRKREG